MKNLLIVVLLLSTVVVGYIAAKGSMRMNLAALRGTTATITRGDLTIPINAARSSRSPPSPASVSTREI